MQYTVRPISDRTWLGTSGREATRFQSSWSATLKLLGREIDWLKGRDVVLEIDVAESDLKLNGELRANARPTSSAVVVAFESKHGPLLYRCDRFYTNWAHQGPEWHHNVRAIALTLEAFRAADRYGATETGKQYTGFKALPAGRAMPASHMTSDEAWSTLGSYQPLTVGEFRARGVNGETSAAYRRARAANHPDRHDGDRALWDKVEAAAVVLGIKP